MTTRVRPLLWVCLAIAAGCGGTDPIEVPDGCQPLLAGHDCLAPYPSDFFRVEDSSTSTGYRIEPLAAASLVSTQGENANVHRRVITDGYSAIPTIVAVLPDEVSPTGLANLVGGIEQSLAADSRTLLVSEDGQLIPHYVDLDPRAIAPERQAIVIHPTIRLAHETRYVVALRSIERPDGELAAAAEGFRRLRQGNADGDVAPLADHYESNIFPLIEAQGWQRDELQLAWDFTVGSHDAAVRDMLRVRELTLAWLQDNEPTITIEEVVDAPESNVFRRVHGTMTGPLFLEADEPGAALARASDGSVEQNGTATFEFTLQIPTSVAARIEPGLALVYGHGFFGSQNEIESNAARTIAEELGAVTFAIDWLGMSTDDLASVLLDLSGVPAEAIDFADRVHQGMANWIVFGRAVAGLLDQQADLQREGGEPLFDSSMIGYLGISQGHILGGTMTALNPYLERLCLQVGGAGFTHMMFRARPFDAFLLIIDGVIDDPLHQQLFVASLQSPFDTFDPASYGRYLIAEPLPGTPADRRVLMQMGLGDVAVPNLGTTLHARILDVPVLEPAPVSLFGLGTVQPPTDQSALAVWDFGIDVAATYAEATPPVEENAVHEGLRVEPTALEQLDIFMTTGTIEHTCSGPCDPE